MSSAKQPPRRWCNVLAAYCCAVLVTLLPAIPLHAQALDELALSAPVDTSSPSAALQGFITSCGRLASMVVAGSRAGRDAAAMPADAVGREEAVAQDLTHQAATAIDLSNIPPAIRERSERERVLMLYDTLRRVSPLVLAQAPKDGNLSAWFIPGTPIKLVRLSEGTKRGEYVFSAETIDGIREIHDRAIKRQALWGGRVDAHAILLENLGGVRPRLLASAVSSLPSAMLYTAGANAIWQWLAFGTIILVAAGAVVGCAFATRYVNPKNAFGELLVSGVPIIVARIAAFAALNAIGLLYMSESVHWLSNAVLLSVAYAAWVWWLIVATIWLSHHVPRHLYGENSIKTAITRLGLRFFGIVVTGIVLARGLEQVGVPMFGIVASLGVGGLALALAAQPTVENLIAGIILFVDQPARVGDECEFDGFRGIVEEIGIRSTTVRLHDGTLITLTNSEFCNMKIRNLGVGHYQFSLDLPLATGVPVEGLRNFIEHSRLMLRNDAQIISESVRVEIDAINSQGIFVKLSGKFVSEVQDPSAAWQQRQLDVLQTTHLYALELATPS